jgi:hypothetical protein
MVHFVLLFPAYLPIYPWAQQALVVTSRVSNPIPHLKALPKPSPQGERELGQAELEEWFPPQVMLALCISWLICFLLTINNVLPSAPTAYGYQARTDAKGNVLSQAPWFRFPYPGEEKMGAPSCLGHMLPGTVRGAQGTG